MLRVRDCARERKKDTLKVRDRETPRVIETEKYERKRERERERATAREGKGERDI